MYGQIFNRELGGVNKYTNWGRSVEWQSPRLTTDMFLERLETASSDYVNLTRYCQGLPIVCQFSKGSNSHLCAVTDECGQVLLFDTRRRTDGEEVPRVHYWQAHDNAVFDYTWVNNDSQCLTGAGDQMVALWDVNTTQKISTLMGHKCSVRTVAACPDNPAQFASGARDGHIFLWDLRVNKKHNCMNNPATSILYAHSLATRAELRRFRRANRAAGPKGVMDTQHTVTCVLYQKENVLISSGANDGCVKLWDTRKWYSNSANRLPQPLHTFPFPGNEHNLKGVVTMCLDPWKSQLFVSHTDCKIYRYELSGTYRKPEEYVHAGRRNDTFFARCATSPDGKYLLSGSGRNTGVIWEVAQPKKRPVFLIGHSEDVSAVDWCPNDMCKLATLSDDMSLRIWRPDSRERNTEDPSIFGYAFSAGIGKVCQRQSRVQIVQDEFPFDPPVSSTSSQSASPGSQSPVQSPSPHQWSDLSVWEDYLSTSLKPRRSPRKLNKEACPLTPTSPLAGRDLSEQASPCSLVKGCRMKERACDDGGSHQELRDKSPQPSTSYDSAECSHHTSKTFFLSSGTLRPAFRDSPVSLSSVDTESSPHTPQKQTRMKKRAWDDGGSHQELRDMSPQPSTSYDSAECSNHTPETTLLFYTPYALQYDSDSSLSLSSEDTKPSSRTPPKQTSGRQDPETPSSRLPVPVHRPGRAAHSPQTGDAGSRTRSPCSPRQSSRSKGLTPVMSPTKFLLLTPTKTSARASSTPASLIPRKLFRSPTASLPNRVLDPPLRLSTPPPTPPQRKVDWLTQLRLARLQVAVSPNQEAVSPNQEACLDVSSIPKASSEESLVSGKKDSNINGTPNQSGSRKCSVKRSLSCVAEQESKNVTPGKRKKQDQTPTPRSGRKRNSFSKPGSTSQTPHRKSSESPKSPNKMSIKRFLK